MKKLFVFAVLAATSFTRLFAQDNTANITEKLIKEKNFVFVATRLEKRPGLNGSSGYAPYVSLNQLNSGSISVAASAALTSRGSSDYYTSEYYRQLAGDGSYFTSYNINQKGKQPNTEVAEFGSVFLIQYPDQFMIRGGGSPALISEINLTEFNAFLTGGYKLSSSKKTNNVRSLVYEVGQGDSSLKYYLDIFEDGKAIFKAQPNKDFTTYLYGYIASPTQLASK